MCSQTMKCKPAKASFFVLVLFLLLYSSTLTAANYDLYSGAIQPRHRVAERALLFPQFTVLQFTYGVSAPAILPNRSINLSICMQQNYDLPWDVTHFYPTLFFARTDNSYDLDRKAFYRYIRNFLDGYGLEGESCLLRSVCEIAQVPLHLETKNNLFEKLAHFILTPSLDEDAENTTKFLSSVHSKDLNFSEKLLLAENIGKRDGNCHETFAACGFSLVDLFTVKYKIF